VASLPLGMLNIGKSIAPNVGPVLRSIGSGLGFGIVGGAGEAKELEDVAGQVAEQTAQVMYGSGVDVSNGLIAGLLAQEQALVAAAETLANAFINAFNKMMATLQIPSMQGPVGINANGFAYNNALAGVSGDDSQFGSGTPWAQAVANYRAQPTVVNNYVTYKAGVIENGKAAGKAVTALVNQYTKASGL